MEMENKQIAITQFGGVENTSIQANIIPKPKGGRSASQSFLSGINPIDVKTRAGLGWAAQHRSKGIFARSAWVCDEQGQNCALGEQAERFTVVIT